MRETTVNDCAMRNPSILYPESSSFLSAVPRLETISYPESSGSLVLGHQEGRWGTKILLPQDFCGKTTQDVTRQPIKKLKFCSNSPESLLAINRWPKSLGTRLEAVGLSTSS